MSRREWDTEIRHPWNPKIHNILQTIDLHTKMYVQTGDEFHQEKSEVLRKYVLELKNWIKSQENET